MDPTLYLLTTRTEYPPLFVTANNTFDAVDLYRDHYGIGACSEDELEVAVEVYKVPVVGTASMVHPPEHSTVADVRDESFFPDGCAPDFETADRVRVLTGVRFR